MFKMFKKKFNKNLSLRDKLQPFVCDNLCGLCELNGLSEYAEKDNCNVINKFIKAVEYEIELKRKAFK